MIFETHAHLDDPRFDADRTEVVDRFRAKGITRLINVGYDLDSSRRSIALASAYPEIYAAVGVHPHDVKGMSEQDWETVVELARAPKVVAIGEIGLDYYRDLSPREAQKEAFTHQITIANDLDLPIIVHNRDAHQDVMNLIRANPPHRGGVLHCFSGSWETAKIALDLGFYISFAGPLTYKNAVNVQDVAGRVPLERLLVETDCPYLSPDPLRGKRNEPANVRHILDKLAQIRCMEVEDLAQITAANGARLFRIALEEKA